MKDLKDAPKKDLARMLGTLGVVVPAKANLDWILDKMESEFLRNTQATLNVVGAYYTSKKLGLKG